MLRVPVEVWEAYARGTFMGEGVKASPERPAIRAITSSQPSVETGVQLAKLLLDLNATPRRRLPGPPKWSLAKLKREAKKT